MASRRILRDSALALAALAFTQPSSVLQLEPVKEKVKENFTGIEFLCKRGTLNSEATGNNHLLGTAVRCMLGQCKFAKARAYAVGLYVEDPNEELRDVGEDIIFQALLKVRTSRTLLLVMDQDVAGHHIGKGFDRSLLPRIRKAQGGRTGPGKDALKEFTRCFNEEKILRRGSEVCLVWRPDDTLVVTINSRVCAEIQSSILCHSIFDMYLGPNSIFKKYRNTSFTFLKDFDRSL